MNMIDQDLVKEKLNLIVRDLDRLKEFSGLTIQEMAGDYIKYAALKNILMEVIGRAIDINSHFISELAVPEMEAPKTYRDTFFLMADLGVLPKDFAEEIARSTGFRNAIVHEYSNLDKMDIYGTVGEAIQQYRRYGEYVLDFIRKMD